MASPPAQDLLQPNPGGSPGYPAVLAYGFRPFFLLAGIYAVLAVPLWLALLHGFGPITFLSPPVWHAHEMLYGFVGAAVAGFMLTAVPSWTGRRGYAGLPLALLVLLWLAGRLLMTLPVALPPLLPALVDLAFFPALALTILPALVRSGNRNNTVFIVLLTLLFVANLHFHLQERASPAALGLGINTMLFMLTLLGGRVVPAFTSAGLRLRGYEIGIPRFQPLDRAALGAVGAILVVDLVLPGGTIAAALAAIATLLLAAQLTRWQGLKTRRDPIIWILHLAYLWLPVCLALKAAWLFGAPLAPSTWLHAASSGAMATMIIGIMSRASLGHTGRALCTPRAVVAAYWLLTAAALTRVFGPVLFPAAISPALLLATALWSGAFLLFLIVYAPILCRPRVDGRPG